jgi:hypothetical protein
MKTLATPMALLLFQLDAEDIPEASLDNRYRVIHERPPYGGYK